MKASSPFRYPGSKSRLLSWIIPQIDKNESTFIDVFAGGGSVFLAVAERDKNRHIIINDADPFIASFWRSVLCEDKVETLVDYISKYTPTVASYEDLQTIRLGEPTTDTAFNGFLALAINRMAFSGICMSGSIGGVTQTSAYKINCRWNPEKLVESVYNCHYLLKDRSEVYSVDFRIILDLDGLFYLDPPYYKQGSALYPIYLTVEQHKNLANLLKLRNNWLLSYDGCQEVYDLYSFAEIEERDEHSMLARKKKKEVLIKPKCTE